MSRAKIQNIPFDLTEEHAWSIFPPDGLCPIFKTKLKWRDGTKLNSPSFDRIDPTKGYVQGNVAIISFRANGIKSNVTDPAVFRRLADWLEALQ